MWWELFTLLQALRRVGGSFAGARYLITRRQVLEGDRAAHPRVQDGKLHGRVRVLEGELHVHVRVRRIQWGDGFYRVS